MPTLYGVSPGQKLGEDFRFRDGSYSSISNFDMNFLGLPVYRADTKQEFLIDLGLLVGTVATSGFYAGFRFALSQAESD